MPSLFDPIQFRDVHLPNRIGVSPMCQFCAEDGFADDWHMVHYGSMATSGAGMMMIEATSVAPEGRISPGDLGLWEPGQLEPLARIARFAEKQGCVPALQLAHAGRKASKTSNWGVEAQRALKPGEGGWSILGPSPVAQDEKHEVPQELSATDIRRIVADFASTAERALACGFSILELHAAHGYLQHQFLSPVSNHRRDEYGGSFFNRTRFTRDVVAAVRETWPERLPLFVRLSATDWVEGGWNIEETVELSRMLRGMGVDLIDVSSGGVASQAVIPTGPGYQTGFAARVRAEAEVKTAAVGLITSAEQADHVVRTGQADLVLLGREIMRNRFWPLHAAEKLGKPATWPAQYLRAAPRGALPRVPLKTSE